MPGLVVRRNRFSYLRCLGNVKFHVITQLVTKAKSLLPVLQEVILLSSFQLPVKLCAARQERMCLLLITAVCLIVGETGRL